MTQTDKWKAEQRQVGDAARALMRCIREDTPEADAQAIERGFDALMEKHDRIAEGFDDAQIDTSRRPFGDDKEARGADGGEPEHRAAFTNWLRAPRSEAARATLTSVEQRTRSGLSGPAGGYVVPEEIATPILSRARDTNPFRDVVRVLNVSTGDVKLPLSNADAAMGWVGELDPRGPTAEPTLAEKSPAFGMAYAYLSMSEELAADALIDVAQWLVEEAGTALGEAEMTAIVSGDGSNKPSGLLRVAPEAGADGARTANAFKYLPSGSTSGVDFDALIAAVYDLKSAYRANARWIMNSRTAGAIRSLKSSDGQYIWRDAMAAGQPPLLLGYPVVIAEAMPNLAEDEHPIAFGDWSRAYALCLRGGLAIQAADQSITTPGQDKLYIRERVGGCPYDENAARFIKIAVS